MKLLIFVAVFLFCTASTPPVDISSRVVNNKTLPDLTRDNQFVKTVIDMYALQSRIIETNSEGLMKQSVMGTLSDAEKTLLATNLGFADYKALNNSFNDMGISILAIKNKYAELNDPTTSTSIINTAIDKLVQENKIAIQNNHPSACLSALFTAVCSCLKASHDCTVLSNCLRAAYAEYVKCKGAGGPR